MAETMKPRGNHAPNESSKMSSYRDCMCVVLKLLADFGKELKLSDGALRIEVNINDVDLPSAPDTRVLSSLQEHIAKLQVVSESLKTLVDADVDTSPKDNTSDDAVTSSSLKEQASALSEHHPPSSEAAEGKTAADDVMVQIIARKSEIERRISAFMERKQMEINENNVREFCNVIDCNQENSCARTDAVFTPYPGFKSHVKVTRVVNTYGPQTRGGGGQGEAGEQQRGPMARDCGNAAIEERLHNIETHLKLPTAGPVPLSVYQRLKRLENRILELEGLSPEYFQSMIAASLGTLSPPVVQWNSVKSFVGCCVTYVLVPMNGKQKPAHTNMGPQRYGRVEVHKKKLFPKRHRQSMFSRGAQSQKVASHLHKRPKTSPAQACSLTELDEKISAVKAALLKRVNDFGPGYGTECPL